MATTTLNTKIKLRYDTLANWQDLTVEGKGGNLILLKGEVAFCEVPSASVANNTVDANSVSTVNGVTANNMPTIIFKVGDGVHAFKDLNWGSALAADVYAWAKAANKPGYTASEITIADADGNTEATNVEAALTEIYGLIDALQGGEGAYSLTSLKNAIDLLNDDSSTEGSVAYAVAQEASRIDAITGTPDANMTLQGEIDAVETDVATLNGDANTSGSVAYAVAQEASRIDAVTGTPDSGKTLQAEIDDVETAITTLNGDNTTTGSVAKSIKDAIDGLNLSTTYAGKAYEGKVDTLIDTDTGKSVRTISAEEVAKIVANAPASYDTLKEIADWIQSDQTGAAKMANDITALQTKTELGTYDNNGTPTQYATVKAYVEAVTGDIDDDVDALDTRLTTAEGDIDTLETAVGVLNGDASTTGSVAKAVADEASRIDAVTGTPDSGKTLQGEIDDLETAVGVLNGDNTTAGSVAKTVKDAVDAIDYTVTAPEIAAADQTDAAFVNVLTGFEIENGGLKTNTTTSQTLAKVATTGRIDHLIYEELVLDGGDAGIPAQAPAQGD